MGGTNKSEYELLTSNSNYLLQGITPFQALDMSNTSSIVSNLQELGYYTISMHPAPAGNYARNEGYKVLGFDEIHFENDFINKEYYGNRKFVSDECTYKYMLRWYEDAINNNDRPVFNYLLTIQNHGDWDTNLSETDIIHVEKYDGKADIDRINEYLSCIYLSCKSFDELVEYFNNSSRPIIVCMVGDHSPAFEEISNSDKNNLLMRETPFIIWANFPIEGKRDALVSMNELGPFLLECAGVDMMPYYQYINELRKKIPVLTSYGKYMDSEGALFSYDENNGYTDQINDYFNLEYTNLIGEQKGRWFKVKDK